MARQTVPVSTRALVQRINRILSKEGKQLKATRGAQAQQTLGEYYIAGIGTTSRQVAKAGNLENLGRSLGALRPYEQLLEEGS